MIISCRGPKCPRIRAFGADPRGHPTRARALVTAVELCLEGLRQADQLRVLELDGALRQLAQELAGAGESASCGKEAMLTTLRSPTIIEERDMDERLPNIHPGEILLEEFLKPLALSQNRVARDLGVPPRRINEIVLGKRAVTADTALRLARYFGTSEKFWLGLQADFDLEEVRRRLGDRLEKEVRPRAAA